jgi:uncharacterized protein DUF6502
LFLLNVQNAHINFGLNLDSMLHCREGLSIMTTKIDLSHNESTSDLTGQNTGIAKVLGRLFAPLARLCLANGITISTAEEILKQVFVQEANALKPGMPMHGTVSRISTATGLTRREVTRLIKSDAPVRPKKPPITTEIFARWTADWRDHDGKPLVIKRQGTAPSFEALAQSITRDIHPRSILDELVRIGIAHFDEDLDCVSLTHNDFVPGGDSRQLLNLLSDNVGDHLDAAVANVLSDVGRHHEQAVFADELSTESIEALCPLVAAQWAALRDAMVPTITGLIESDRLAGRVQDQRMRIGLYTFNENTGTPTEIPSKHSPKKVSSKESKK